jgi:hypothetical protein
VKRKGIKSAVSLILRFSVILTIFLTLSNLDFALAEGVTLTVSCTMPSIPGLNAPMIEEKSTRTQDNQGAVQQQATTFQNDIKTQNPSILQTDKETTAQSAAPMLIKTFYSR